MSVVHFHNILLAKPACFAARERGLLLTVVPGNVTCPECINYLRGGTYIESPPRDAGRLSGASGYTPFDP